MANIDTRELAVGTGVQLKTYEDVRYLGCDLTIRSGMNGIVVSVVNTPYRDLVEVAFHFKPLATNQLSGAIHVNVLIPKSDLMW